MGIKLVILCICLSSFLESCTTAKKSQEIDFFVPEEDFVKAYKVAVISGCMNEGTRENFKEFITNNNDPGLFTEIGLISLFTVKEADSIGRLYAKSVKQINYADAGNGKPYFSRCINFALSKELDKIAREKYRESLKNNK